VTGNAYLYPVAGIIHSQWHGQCDTRLMVIILPPQSIATIRPVPDYIYRWLWQDQTSHCSAVGESWSCDL